jgi:mannosyl-oligosaccharide alpha-1,2-mannosidase
VTRPEAIESVFILYRITGDKAYQDIAWEMFESIENATKTHIANSAVDDVTQVTPAKADRMESFWLAETLKYFYLVFSEPDLISLDDYVL